MQKQSTQNGLKDKRQIDDEVETTIASRTFVVFWIFFTTMNFTFEKINGEKSPTKERDSLFSARFELTINRPFT